MVVTGIARAFLIIATSSIIYGCLTAYSEIVAIGCGVFLWLGMEAAYLHFQTTWQLQNATVMRTLSDRGGSEQTLWENSAYAVQTDVAFASGLGGIAVEVVDLYPVTFNLEGGSAAAARAPRGENILKIRYQLRACEIGVCRFFGLRMTFSSPCQLFTSYKLLHCASEYLVVPSVFRLGVANPLIKQFNRISPPGIHAHRRPGSGSELLEIREYVPGDPPKSIAWKLSARRDQLMSKQFECEVPLRCTLFIDTSASVYLRANRPPVIQPFVRLAANLIEFLTASRDPVGVVTFDSSSFRVSKHSASRRAALRLVRDLTRKIDDVPTSSRAATSVNHLIQLGLGLASNLYPDLYAISHHGFGIRPVAAVRLRRRRLRQRYMMAGILCATHNLPVHSFGQLLYDDERLASELQRFLLEHNWGFGPSRQDLDLENVAEPGKVANLTRLLRHSIAHSRDPERFVILADLLHVADRLSPLAGVIRTAQAQGHRVSVVCAWDETDVIESTTSVASADLPVATRRNANQLFANMQSTFLHRRFQQLQKEMARAKVRVIGIHENSAIQQMLAQLEMARPGRIAT